MVVNPCGADWATSMENSTDKERLLLNPNCDRCSWCEDSNVAFTYVQLHYYCVRQVEPYHQLG